LKLFCAQKAREKAQQEEEEEVDEKAPN